MEKIFFYNTPKNKKKYNLIEKNVFIRADAYNLGDYLMAFPKYTSRTYGNLFEISSKMLDILDIYKVVPESFIRVLMEVYREKKDKTEEMIGKAWVYVGNPDLKKTTKECSCCRECWITPGK